MVFGLVRPPPAHRVALKPFFRQEGRPAISTSPWPPQERPLASKVSKVSPGLRRHGFPQRSEYKDQRGYALSGTGFDTGSTLPGRFRGDVRPQSPGDICQAFPGHHDPWFALYTPLICGIAPNCFKPYRVPPPLPQMLWIFPPLTYDTYSGRT